MPCWALPKAQCRQQIYWNQPNKRTKLNPWLKSKGKPEGSGKEWKYTNCFQNPQMLGQRQSRALLKMKTTHGKYTGLRKEWNTVHVANRGVGENRHVWQTTSLTKHPAMCTQQAAAILLKQRTHQNRICHTEQMKEPGASQMKSRMLWWLRSICAAAWRDLENNKKY